VTVTPQAEIARLDRQLQQRGEDIVLSRKSATGSVDVTCRAKVSDYQPHELLPGTGLAQGDSRVVISPTQINDAGWPGDAPAVAGDPRLPMSKDSALIGGRRRAVKAVAPVYMQNVLIRINLVVSG